MVLSELFESEGNKLITTTKQKENPLIVSYVVCKELKVLTTETPYKMRVRSFSLVQILFSFKIRF